MFLPTLPNAEADLVIPIHQLADKTLTVQHQQWATVQVAPTAPLVKVILRLVRLVVLKTTHPLRPREVSLPLVTLELAVVSSRAPSLSTKP